VCLPSWPLQAQYSGGRGTADDPYQIATAADLIALGETPGDYDKHFILTADVDLAPNLPGGKVFDKGVIAPGAGDDFLKPAGTGFTGSFDGKGCTIRNLTISGGADGYLGLFAQVWNGGRIHNICLENADIRGALGSSCLGTLVGANYEGIIDSCYTIGSVVGGEESEEIGGLVGHNQGTIAYCCAGGSVFAGKNSKFTGGLVGWNSGQITQCYANVGLFGSEKSTWLGGLVGCDVNRQSDNHLSDCFWNVETSALLESDGGIGLTIAQMRDPNTFVRAGWDFVDIPDDSDGIWAEPAGGGFPILWWQLPESQRPPLPSFAGGTGRPGNPYLISTVAALNRIGSSPRLRKAHFKLTADLDLKDIDLVAIGSEGSPFAGVFDGNGHTISHFTCITTGTAYTGLFACVDGLQAEVKNLGLLAPQVETETARDLGALVGRLADGTIRNCYVQDGNVSGRSYLLGREGGISGGLSTAGGLVGTNRGTVIDCHATCSVFGSSRAGGLAGMNTGTIINCDSSGDVSGNMCVGGLLGTNDTNGEVTGCSAMGNVLAIHLFTEPPRTVLGHWQIEPKGLRAGGLVGENTARIINSYARGSVSGSDIVGGLVGSNGYIQRWDVHYEVPGEIINSYSTGTVSGTSKVGGLVGLQEIGPVISSFWDIQTSGQTTSAAGVGKTTAQMQDFQTYLDAGWDLVGEIQNGMTEIWQMPLGGGYPILSVFAGYAPPQLKGSGTPDDPYLISSATELGAVGHYSPLAHYRLAASLDLSGIRWGTAVIPRFEGTFDGNGHTISHLTIQGRSHLGLFGQVRSGAQIKNLGVVDVNVVGSSDYVGGLVGVNAGAMTGCYSTGAVTCGASRQHYGIGGLIGGNSGAVTRCHSAVTVSGTSFDAGGLVGGNGGSLTECYSTGIVSTTGENVGGLVGSNVGAVSQCYCTGVVTTTGRYAGGLVGRNGGSLAECYSTGAVSTTGGDVGGLAGNNDGTVTRCYSTGMVSGKSNVGGLVGSAYLGSVTAFFCFWDTQTSGQATSVGGTGKTTAEMQMAKTFLDGGWDFVGEMANGTEDFWWIDEGKDYPRLWWEREEIRNPNIEIRNKFE
jgi:hypothetical protein